MTALKAESKGATVQTKAVAYSPWGHLPRPYAREMAGEAAEPQLHRDAELGVDAEERATFLRHPVPGRFQQVFSWGPDWCEVVWPAVHSTLTHSIFEGGRLIEEIRVDGTRRLDGEPAVSVTRWHYDAKGRPVLAVETYESGEDVSFGGPERGPYWLGKLYQLSYDERGGLSRISRAHSRDGVADGDDVDAAQDAALVGQGVLFQDATILYEATPLRTEHQHEGADPDRLRAVEEGELPSREALIRDYAVTGFRLVPAPINAKPAAIIGGPGLLPPGVGWPRSDVGRDLGFLAAVDFGALPPSPDGAPSLPTAGWLLCFADVDDPTGYDPTRWNEPQPEPAGWEQGRWYGEPTPNTPGASAQVLWVPPGTEPIPTTGPGLRGKYPAQAQRRVAVPQNTLPDGPGAVQAIGFSVDHAEAYAAVARELRYGAEPLELPADHTRKPDDWVLGAVTGVQGGQADDDSLLLLHLSSVEFQDGGAIQVRIPPNALATQDWAQAYMVADSA